MKLKKKSRLDLVIEIELWSVVIFGMIFKISINYTWS